MSQDSTLHVKIDSETDGKLKQLAVSLGKSKGQLVREALSACYQGGYISLSKLAREMGMHALQLRSWLAEQGIAQRNAHSDEDARRA